MSELKVNKISPRSGTDVTLGDSGDTITIAGTIVGVFPAGTKMLFVQTTAPTGWTKDTTHDNKALRVVSGTASSGGTVGFTTAFASQAVSGTVGNATLTEAQMPSHFHTTLIVAKGNDYAYDGLKGGTDNNNVQFYASDSKGGSTSHNHSFTGTAINLAVTYVDTIIATKD
jgi:hypothetical protein